MAINNSTNAGLLAVRHLVAFIPSYLQKLQEFTERQGSEVLAKVDKLDQVGWENY